MKCSGNELQLKPTLRVKSFSPWKQLICAFCIFKQLVLTYLEMAFPSTAGALHYKEKVRRQFFVVPLHVSYLKRLITNIFSAWKPCLLSAHNYNINSWKEKRLEWRLPRLVTTLTWATFLSYLGSGPPSIKNYLRGILKVPASSQSRVCHRWLMMRKVSQTSSTTLGPTGRGVGFTVFYQRGDLSEPALSSRHVARVQQWIGQQWIGQQETPRDSEKVRRPCIFIILSPAGFR